MKISATHLDFQQRIGLGPNVKTRRIEMKKTILSVVVACLCLSSYAGDAKKAPKISLTKADVEKCVKTLPDFMKANPEFKPNPTASNNSNALSSMLQGAAVKAKVEAFAVKHGYAHFNDFAKALGGVISAYSALKLDHSMADLKKQAAANPQMASAVKMQEKMFSGLIKKMLENITPETLEAVKPFYATLDKIFMNGN